MAFSVAEFMVRALPRILPFRKRARHPVLSHVQILWHGAALYYSLLVAHCSLLFTHCSLLVAHCSPEVFVKIDLSGKNALVTGASRGIGEAIAKRLAESGAFVMCAARSAERVAPVVAEIEAAGGRAIGVELDITGDDIRERIAALISQHEKIDILVNNAGVTADDLFLRMKPEAWKSVIDTNVNSLYPITQEVVKKMLRLKWGRIINISSVVGMMGNPGQANYAASKAAIIGFTKALAQEIGSRNITVNAIAPGFIRTAMTEDLGEQAKQALETRIALRRLGTPDDIAWAAVFLASDNAGYITGTVLNVSGGLYT